MALLEVHDIHTYYGHIHALPGPADAKGLARRMRRAGFAGGLHDPDTALVRFGARDYDPATGRWTTGTRAAVRSAGQGCRASAGSGRPVVRADRSRASR